MRYAPIVLLCACDRVLGLQQRVDAAPLAYADVQLDAIPTDGGITGCRNGDAGDEDGDADLDGCDNCPGRPNADQIDTDRDGIGDVCDPHPLYAIERLAYFHAFATAPEGTGFGGGGWQQIGGAWFQSKATTLHALWLLGMTRYRSPTVEVQARNEMRGGQTSFAGVALVFDPAAVATATPDMLLCNGDYAATDELQLQRYVAGARDELVRTGLLGEAGTPVMYSFARGSLEAIHRCTAWRVPDDPAIQNSVVEAPVDPVDPEAVGVALYTRNLSVFFQSVTVYETIWP